MAGDINSLNLLVYFNIASHWDANGDEALLSMVLAVRPFVSR